MGNRELVSLSPTEILELDNGLFLSPRVRFTLTIYPFIQSAAKPLDEWKLKRALLDFLKTSISVSVTVPEDDLLIKRYKDLKKRKRDDPVASGSLYIRDLGFIKCEEKEGTRSKVLEKKLAEWRNGVVEKMDGIELNLEGDKYRLSVQVPESDDFDRMSRAWEELQAFGNRGGYTRGGRQEPDTIIIKGVPSRWFAEPRVSSKPSMLVTHTIFSAFGNIRNLDVAEDDGQLQHADGDGNLISGLHCKIVVQFEKHKDFYNALKALCGRSLQKKGTRLKADYEATWAKDGFFRNSRSQPQEKSNRLPAVAARHPSNEAPRRESYISADETRRKKFRE